MSIWPVKKATAWARLLTAMISTPSTTAASAALSLGTTSPRRPACWAAAMAIDSAPLVGRVQPSSASSPTTAYWANRSEAICPLPASMPSVIGRSNEAACLGSSAGARLMTTRSCGRRKPELTIARSTRCVLSLTAASGKPTRTVLGSAPGETSTSTSTGKASMPTSEKVFSFASMVERMKDEGCLRRAQSKRKTRATRTGMGNAGNGRPLLWCRPGQGATMAVGAQDCCGGQRGGDRMDARAGRTGSSTWDRNTWPWGFSACIPSHHRRRPKIPTRRHRAKARSRQKT